MTLVFDLMLILPTDLKTVDDKGYFIIIFDIEPSLITVHIKSLRHQMLRLKTVNNNNNNNLSYLYRLLGYTG